LLSCLNASSSFSKLVIKEWALVPKMGIPNLYPAREFKVPIEAAIYLAANSLV
jgi:hypothetical protein